jgi:hypothetical protein
MGKAGGDAEGKNPRARIAGIGDPAEHIEMKLDALGSFIAWVTEFPLSVRGYTANSSKKKLT